MALPDEPAADADPATVCTVRMRGPDGKQYTRRFLKATGTLQDILNWFKIESKDNSTVELVIPYCKKDLSDRSKTLGELAFAKQENVMVKYC